MPALEKVLNLDGVDRLLYTERPVCPRALQAAMRECLERAFTGSGDNQIAIALCLEFAASGNEPETVRKFFQIACTGRLPFVP
ncbi:MAG: hypothetical protein ABSE90_07205 [Verrucomicrobiota bacterium]|jgi:hypothetical protein